MRVNATDECVRALASVCAYLRMCVCHLHVHVCVPLRMCVCHGAWLTAPVHRPRLSLVLCAIVRACMHACVRSVAAPPHT